MGGKQKDSMRGTAVLFQACRRGDPNQSNRGGGQFRVGRREGGDPAASVGREGPGEGDGALAELRDDPLELGLRGGVSGPLGQPPER